MIHDCDADELGMIVLDAKTKAIERTTIVLQNCRTSTEIEICLNSFWVAAMKYRDEHDARIHAIAVKVFKELDNVSGIYD